MSVCAVPTDDTLFHAFFDTLRPEVSWAEKQAALKELRAALKTGSAPVDEEAFWRLFADSEESIEEKYQTLRAHDPVNIGEEGVVALIRSVRSRSKDLVTPFRAALTRLGEPAEYLGIFGTGGDHREEKKLNTLNISTIAALMAATIKDEQGRALAPIVKVGSPAVTSRIGASNLIGALQTIHHQPGLLAEQLQRSGFVFVSPAALDIPYQAALVEARRRVFEARAIDPIKICVPAAGLMDPRAQITGVSDPRMIPFIIACFEDLIACGVLERAIVLHSYSGVDELHGPSLVIEVTAQGLRGHDWRPEDFGLQSAEMDVLGERSDLSDQAAYTRRVLENDDIPAGLRDMLVWNAALLLSMNDDFRHLPRHIEALQKAYQSGAVAQNFRRSLGESL